MEWLPVLLSLSVCIAAGVVVIRIWKRRYQDGFSAAQKQMADEATIVLPRPPLLCDYVDDRNLLTVAYHFGMDPSPVKVERMHSMKTSEVDSGTNYLEASAKLRTEFSLFLPFLASPTIGQVGGEIGGKLRHTGTHTTGRESSTSRTETYDTNVDMNRVVQFVIEALKLSGRLCVVGSKDTWSHRTLEQRLTLAARLPIDWRRFHELGQQLNVDRDDLDRLAGKYLRRILQAQMLQVSQYEYVLIEGIWSAARDSSTASVPGINLQLCAIEGAAMPDDRTVSARLPTAGLPEPSQGSRLTESERVRAAVLGTPASLDSHGLRVTPLAVFRRVEVVASSA